MKRVKAACICQTLHFMLKEDMDHSFAVKQVQDEVNTYKKRLDQSRTLYRIVEETTEADGSVIIKILKQYNSSPVGSYLD